MSKETFIKDSKVMSELKASLFIEYNKERTGIHVSDIIFCPRETCFRRLQPKQITDIEVNFFTSGRAIHDAIQTLAKHYPKYEIEKEIEFIPVLNAFTKGIVEEKLNSQAKNFKILAHIDIFDSENNIPIEAKSVRAAKLEKYDKVSKTWSEKKAKPHQIEQLKVYMALTDSEKGYLLYQLLLNYDSYPFEIFEVTLTKEERITILQNLVKDALNLLTGITTKDPSIVKHIAKDQTKNWKCNNCKYLNQCLELRKKENE